MSKQAAARARLSRARGIDLTGRDRTIIATATSLGHATSEGLRRLISPSTSPNTFTSRLRVLVARRYLTRTDVIVGLRRIYLYGPGPRSREPGSPRSWAPALTQLAHTLAVETTLIRLLDPTLAPAISRTGWHGEAEHRAWARPGEPYPDLNIRWEAALDGDEIAGQWAVEVDRASEAKAAWRRKLARYWEDYTATRQILVVTTSDTRARNLARLAAADGYPAITTTFTRLHDRPEPLVWDSAQRRKSTLSEASIDYAAEP